VRLRQVAEQLRQLGVGLRAGRAVHPLLVLADVEPREREVVVERGDRLFALLVADALLLRPECF
jgi:hypothetical protein